MSSDIGSFQSIVRRVLLRAGSLAFLGILDLVTCDVYSELSSRRNLRFFIFLENFTHEIIDGASDVVNFITTPLPL